ncbi:hypothetical protein C4M97_03375 [Mycoplasmopsis pullorum]|uniref:ABC transporter ATP-binding protein n=1 Tax=Mycoplasmopsis pullorum TaxID=48003 RepID=UPI00111A5AD9|nr:ABC transporter ATP-binding protein [Mycoplasmopsis pullorum]TNK81661.1 hypothetical protein C4M94_03420 [Mycoplasmopsis pullorum]TNK82945.1 hypothetical protein C4M80_01890 [Mycoplasmopsis pullorum]TNK84310.1 hypothetical protein C4M81_02700 [Mycoplasmopsis pullorum]TNK84498.1 hypothetical protein C4M92_03355 [Mycoplasmopsis pullorum]TNK86566.1 hypothetical protein C4M82_03085 [Mycoplasmopsis pullorum]
MKNVAKKNISLFILMILFAGLVFCINYFEIYYLNQFISNLEDNVRISTTQKNLIFFLLISLAFVFFTLFSEFFYILAAFLFKKTVLRELINEHLSKNPSKWALVSKNDVVVSYTNGPEFLVNAYYLTILQVFINVVSFISSIVMIGILSPIALSYIIPLSLIALVAPVCGQFNIQELTEFNNDLMIKPKQISANASNMLFSSSVNNNFTILEHWYQKELKSTLIQKLPRLSHLYGLYYFWNNCISLVYSFLIILISLLISLYKPNLLPLTVFTTIFVTLPNLKTFVNGSLNTFLSIYVGKAQFSQFRSNLYSKIFDDFNLPESLTVPTGTIQEIKYNNAKIITPEEKTTILSNVNLRINQNNKIVIFGHSGSGKSSLIKYLSGLLPFSSETQIELNNNKVNNLDLFNVSYLSREKGDLIEGTLMENLTFFDPNKEAQTRDLIDIFKLSELDLNESVDTNNYQYSLGQLQRIQLIRALNSDKEVLFLDESLSNIDHKTLDIILEYISKLNRTIILVSHNLTHTQQSFFNRVWKIEQGAIYEVK